MFNNLDATNFSGAIPFYDTNFEDLLSKITICYKKMAKEHLQLQNKENAIRDILLLKYLKNDDVREEVGLVGLYNFEREVQEDNSKGRTDIKVTSQETFKKQKAYYTIECKRLDKDNLKGRTGLNAEYVINGISRFTTRYYSSFYRVNAMIGFIVEKLDIHENTTKHINSILTTDSSIQTTEEITKDNFIKNFEFHYHSKHMDIENQELKIYHLMFDFSSNMQ
ncbi:hypothetical protein [Tenacibaculum sp. M341]|uniref:hypothetical protein n=1 Tax=Tenacibaculum sp. M341 TaxID=2530339 RepID=UPI00104D3CD4|nr:hypothetical protein [Tenacibaculum sp. M341]TCI93745.1 hypothetical protein EYW44_04835 [Tenacibaculum sp. M341]